MTPIQNGLRGLGLPTLIALSLLVAGEGLAAQAAERGPVVMQLPAGARALGLGAFQPAAGDSDAVFANPAWASRSGGFVAGWHRFGTATTALSLSAAGDAFGGGVALGVRTFSHRGTGSDGILGLRAGGVDPLFDESGVPTHEMVATLAWGRDLLGLRVGAAASWVEQRIDGSNASTYAFDVGVATALGPGQLGLAIRNLGPDPEFGGSGPRLPTEVSLGWGAYGRPLGPLDLGAAVDVTRRADGEVLVGGGLEFGYWPIQGRTFVARLGARTVPEGEASPLTLGGSFWGDDLVLDYAWQPVEGTEGVHRISLGWR